MGRLDLRLLLYFKQRVSMAEWLIGLAFYKLTLNTAVMYSNLVHGNWQDGTKGQSCMTPRCCKRHLQVPTRYYSQGTLWLYMVPVREDRRIL